MKKSILLSAALILCTTLYAQAPQGITHQAVIRNTQGELVTNQEVGIQVSILQSSTEGTAVFVETHQPESNLNGLITYVIGQGTTVSGSIAEIDWSDGPYYLKTEADPAGGTDYSITGVTQFLSVPYAMHSQTSSDAFSGDMKGERIVNLADPVGEQDAVTKAYVDLLASYVESLLERIEALENELFPPTVTDIDGNVYQTVIIGNQEWMTENLRVTRYNNEDEIPTDLSNAEWGSTTEGAYAIYPHEGGITEDDVEGINSDEEMVEAYGKLYNWYAVDDSRGLCPEGWKVPSDAEWTQLVDYVVSQGYPNEENNPNGAGNALKSCRQVGSPLGGDCDTSEHPRWDSHDTHHGFDEFGFSALPGGFRWESFDAVGSYGNWWTSTDPSSAGAWVRYMGFNRGNVGDPVGGDSNYKTFGFSLRCVRDISDIIYGDGVTDIDGNEYVTVIIGNQEWMAENLRVTRYNNGDDIPTGLSNEDWGDTTEGAYAIYNNNNDMLEAYGKLYNWYAVDDSRGLCPEGWSVPSHDDWTQLEQYICSALGNSDCETHFPYDNTTWGWRGTNEGNALKSCRQVGSPLEGCNTSEHPRWNSHSTHYGFDEFGFSALPGGDRNATGGFYLLGALGRWWSSTERSSTYAWRRTMLHGYGSVSRVYGNKAFGLSLRCVRVID